MTSRLGASTTAISTALALAGLTACTVEINKAPPPHTATAPHHATPAPAPPRHGPAPLPAPPIRTVHTAAPPVNLVHAAPVPATDKVNVQAISQLKARSGRTCGAKMVAPGQWVHIDCAAYKPLTRSVPHMSPIKLQAMSAKSRVFRAANPRMASSRMGTSMAVDSYPDTVDHRTDGGEGPVKDQGEVGDCTAFSLSTVMDNQLRRASQTQTVSPTHLWSHYGQPDMQLAGDSNINKGIITFDVWPYSGKEACEFESDGDPESAEECQEAYGAKLGAWQSDSKAKSNQTNADANGTVKIGEVDALSSPPNIQEMQSVLSSGSDIWIGIRMNGDAWSNSAMKQFVIPNWSSIDGGHAVAIAGYRKVADGTHQFLIHNSWAASWGDGGYAWISEAMVTKYIEYMYKVKLATAQPAVLTDDDCSATQLVDSVTGQCANICADGSRPASNACPTQ